MNTPSICETRDAKMVSLESKKVTCRTARFLQPLAENVHPAASIPHTPLTYEVFPHHLQQWPSRVLFKGWRSPQKDWGQWVQELAVRHKMTWEKSGIYDAILISTYEIRCNLDVVLGLVEFWCPETSTFLLPWGDATITLEDIMILGGYSVSGKPVRGLPTGNLVKIVEEMESQRLEFYRSKSKKATHGKWLKRYMGVNNEFEHVAFLSLWLSRFVFPQLPGGTLGKYVFPIAAEMSQGTPLALAPAVLASLYRDLTFLKKKAMMSSSESISVVAPFQLLQLWVFERFPSLRPKAPNSLDQLPGEPRVARWSKLNPRFNLQLVKSVVTLKENFLWRPYDDKEFMRSSCAQCLEATELVGIDCKEKYQPQRVAMQFGFDQESMSEPEDARKGSRMNYHKTSTSAESIEDKQVPTKSAGSPSPAFHKMAQPCITRELNDEMDLQPISMLGPKWSTMEEAANSSHKYPPSSGAVKNLGRQIQGSNIRGKPVKPQCGNPTSNTTTTTATTTTQFKFSCHSSKDELPSETEKSNIIRKRKLSPINTEDNLQKTGFPMGSEQNSSLVCKQEQDVSSKILNASEDTSDDSLDFLPLSHAIKRNKINREQEKIFPVKAAGSVEEGEDYLVNTAIVCNHAELEERLQKLEKIILLRQKPKREDHIRHLI